MRNSIVIAVTALAHFTVALALSTPAKAAGIGEAMAVIDAAGVSGRVGDRTLTVGSQVFIGDTVATDASGEAQLLFADGTRMVVGPSASLMIDDFVFRGTATEKKFVVRALGGAFRFISGDSGDWNYRIHTPAAMISVRGTAFDYTVVSPGGTRLVLHQGEATMCGDSGNCETARSQCEMLTAGRGQKVRKVAIGSGLARELRDSFPYLISQSTLLQPFGVEGHSCDEAAGGLSDFALDRSAIRNAARFAGGAAGGAVFFGGICLLTNCGGGGGGGPAIDTNNGTNWSVNLWRGDTITEFSL